MLDTSQGRITSPPIPSNSQLSNKVITVQANLYASWLANIHTGWQYNNSSIHSPLLYLVKMFFRTGKSNAYLTAGVTER